MKHWLAILPLLIAPAAIAADEDGASPALLVAGENDSQWRPLFESLAAQAPIASAFTETRWFPFRKTPVTLTGELRISPEHGLSLRYLTPKERIMIVDEDGILLRDARGRSKTVPPNPRASNADAALLAILRFDLDELLQTYDVQPAGDPGNWEFVFTPKDPETLKSIGRITVSGIGDAVNHLEFSRSETQRVEIEIGEAETQVTFTPEDLEKFFR